MSPYQDDVVCRTVKISVKVLKGSKGRLKPRVMSLEKLLDWAKEHNVLFSPNISFQRISENNIGCFTREELVAEPQDLEGKLIRLPLELAITTDFAAKVFDNGDSGDFHDMREKLRDSNTILKLFLAYERAGERISKSSVKPYLECLPKASQMNIPFYWKAEYLDFVEGSNLKGSLKDNLKRIIEEWWNIINLLPKDFQVPKEHYINMKFYYEYKFYSNDDLHDYLLSQEDGEVDNWTSFPNFLWANAIIRSRAFPAYLIKDLITSSSWEISKSEVMLLPIIDLLNHNAQSKVTWGANLSSNNAYFDFSSESIVAGKELFNNYGMKSNEELLFSYGFCLENNAADTAAVKIIIPPVLINELNAHGIRLPSIGDYTNSVIPEIKSATYEESNLEVDNSEGILFFISKSSIPENLIQIFQFLVRNQWENKISLRSKLAGLNRLRSAIETKLNLLPTATLKDSSDIAHFINNYVLSQREIFSASIRQIKHLEKNILTENKKHLLSLKSVIKKDKKFAMSLLVAYGVNSYEQLALQNLQDQTWLLYLIRCYNREFYINSDLEDEVYLPEWIYEAFKRLMKEIEITAEQVVQFKGLYEEIILPLNASVPEIYDKGKWRVEELIISAKLLDTISFQRGKDNECILVEPFNQV